MTVIRCRMTDVPRHAVRKVAALRIKGRAAIMMGLLIPMRNAMMVTKIQVMAAPPNVCVSPFAGMESRRGQKPVKGLHVRAEPV